MRVTVQVAYASVPPGLTWEASARSMATCWRAMSTISSGFKRQRISGWRRSVPRPEQGASRNTASKERPGIRSSASSTSPTSASDTWMPKRSTRSSSTFFLNARLSSATYSSIWAPHRRSAPLWRRIVFVARPAPTSRNDAGFFSGSTLAATCCDAASDTRMRPWLSSRFTSGSSSVRGSSKRRHPGTSPPSISTRSTCSPTRSNARKTSSSRVLAALTATNSGAGSFEARMNSKAASGPRSFMSKAACHAGNAWSRASASMSRFGSAKGNSARRRTSWRKT